MIANCVNITYNSIGLQINQKQSDSCVIVHFISVDYRGKKQRGVTISIWRIVNIGFWRNKSFASNKNG